MDRHAAGLKWIDDQRGRMKRLVTDWCNLNSGTGNVAGVTRMVSVLRDAFAPLGGETSEIALPPYERIDANGQCVPRVVGPALLIRQRPDAPLRVLLGIHCDTVYAADHPFQVVTEDSEGRLRGPGVIDAKGGLAVMLIALEAFERSPLAARLGWEVIINPDEEIGSPASRPLLVEVAKRNHLGLLFEPAMDERGTMVSHRGGSGNFSVIVRGRAAHAGRAIADGRNAVVAAARLAVALDALHAEPGITCNVARIDGGGPLNVVPDLAVLRFNVRAADADATTRATRLIDEKVAEAGRADGISVQFHGGFASPPKPVTPDVRRLMSHLEACGRELGIPIAWQRSGGVSDGNRLAAAGLPCIDSLGPRGGSLHSDLEYLITDSLTERAKLTALLLLGLAAGTLQWPPPGAD